MTTPDTTNSTTSSTSHVSTEPIVDGADLLDQVRAAMSRYVVLPSPEALDAVVLWIAATHAQPSWACAPRLVIRAPEKRCGKSRLLDLIEAVVHNPLITVNASPAAVYRSIGTNDPPTILLDEADTIFGPKAGDSNEELRGLLNAGHQRNRNALRYNAATNSVEHIPTFAMAALAGIGVMPDTIEDRAVVVRMRRRAPGENVDPFRHKRDAPVFRILARQLHKWARANAKAFEAAAPAMPLEDRAADTWEPLFSIAAHAGRDWPERARAAALALTADHDASTEEPFSVRLLADCRTAFGPAEVLPTEDLLERLKEDPESPWPTWGGRGDGLTAMKLGVMLREYDIRSTKMRLPDVGQVRGYLREDFTDAWDRYCPSPTEADTAPAGLDDEYDGRGKPPQPPQPSHPSSGARRLESWGGLSRLTHDHQGPGDGAWDGSSRPTQKAASGLTCDGTAGAAGAASTPPPATCIACRTPLSYDDGTGAHPLCRTA